MRVKNGSRASQLKLPQLAGGEYNSEKLLGKPYLLSFFSTEFSSFESEWFQELRQRYDELENNISVIMVVDKCLMQEHGDLLKGELPFIILADNEHLYYRSYGMSLRVNNLIYRFGHWVYRLFRSSCAAGRSWRGGDFLIDSSGVIQGAFYSSGNHLPFGMIKDFSRWIKSGRQGLTA